MSQSFLKMNGTLETILGKFKEKAVKICDCDLLRSVYMRYNSHS